ncbi:MAG TPA: hypothetical protein DD706_10310 [Nitrospiraceae bacterium]|nr:hypothetical protein [Nitrospiraceae bacterium]
MTFVLNVLSPKNPNSLIMGSLKRHSLSHSVHSFVASVGFLICCLVPYRIPSLCDILADSKRIS